MKTVYVRCSDLTAIERRVVRKNILNLQELLRQSMQPGQMLGLIVEEQEASLEIILETKRDDNFDSSLN